MQNIIRVYLNIIMTQATSYHMVSRMLNQISQIDNIASIAMPYNIGCGTAGGDWDVYFQMIKNFANNYQIHVTLYKLY